MSDNDTPQDTASILYPDDPPRAVDMPDWRKADIAAAETRLMGKAPAPAAAPAAGDDAEVPDLASALYDDDEQAGNFDETGSNSFFNQQALKALEDDDRERSQALGAAGKALVADMKAAGTSSADFDEALTIVNEAAYETLTDAEIDARQAETIATLEREYGGEFKRNIDAANRFIRDLDKIAPGTIMSLQASGAGNDPRIIRKAVKEALRRGY